MSNYPPGTWEGDPRAPWNAIEVTVVCGACGVTSDEQQEEETCESCEAGVMSEYEAPEPCMCRGENCYC